MLARSAARSSSTVLAAPESSARLCGGDQRRRGAGTARSRSGAPSGSASAAGVTSRDRRSARAYRRSAKPGPGRASGTRRPYFERSAYADAAGAGNIVTGPASKSIDRLDVQHRGAETASWSGTRGIGIPRGSSQPIERGIASRCSGRAPPVVELSTTSCRPPSVPRQPHLIHRGERLTPGKLEIGRRSRVDRAERRRRPPRRSGIVAVDARRQLRCPTS